MICNLGDPMSLRHPVSISCNINIFVLWNLLNLFQNLVWVLYFADFWNERTNDNMFCWHNRNMFCWHNRNNDVSCQRICFVSTYCNIFVVSTYCNIFCWHNRNIFCWHNRKNDVSYQRICFVKIIKRISKFDLSTILCIFLKWVNKSQVCYRVAKTHRMP